MYYLSIPSRIIFAISFCIPNFSSSLTFNSIKDYLEFASVYERIELSFSFNSIKDYHKIMVVRFVFYVFTFNSIKDYPLNSTKYAEEPEDPFNSIKDYQRTI